MEEKPSLLLEDFNNSFPVLYKKGNYVIRDTSNKRTLYKYSLYSMKDPFYPMQSSGSIDTLKNTINSIINN